MQALISVLKSNLRKTEIGPEKIDRGEFVIQETSTKRDIDLTRDWDLCFLPGQRVEMSMIFKRPMQPYRTCPSCYTLHSPSEDENIDCDTCGMTFRSITEASLDVSMDTHQQEDKSLQNTSSASEAGPRRPGELARIDHDCDTCTAVKISLFRRVRLSGISLMIATLYIQDCKGHLDGKRTHAWRNLGTGLCTIRKAEVDHPKLQLSVIQSGLRIFQFSVSRPLIDCQGEHYLVFVSESLSSISTDEGILNRRIQRLQGECHPLAGQFQR